MKKKKTRHTVAYKGDICIIVKKDVELLYIHRLRFTCNKMIRGENFATMLDSIKKCIRRCNYMLKTFFLNSEKNYNSWLLKTL